MAGFSYSDKPKYAVFCPNCKFITSISIHGTNEVLKTVDVYKSCQENGSDFVINYSDEPGDYATVDLQSLFGYYVLGHFGELYKKFNDSIYKR